MTLTETLQSRYQRDDLPSNWVLTDIGSIASINPGGKDLRELDDDYAVTFVPMAAIDAEKGSISEPQQRFLGEVRRGFTPFREGDVVWAKITPCMENGKAAIAKKLDNGLGLGSTELHVIRPEEGVLSEWIFHYVRQSGFRERAKIHFTGAVGQQRVPASFIREFPIPLAPLDEQRRIVAEIEKQFSRLDAGIAALKRAQANLRRYRASVLKTACEGRLVPQDPNDEPASELLKRILAERRAKWEAEQRAKGKDPAKLRYKEPQGPDTSELPELPSGWCWAYVEQLGNTESQSVLTGPFGSNLGKEDFVESGIPVLTIGCLTEQGLTLDKAYFVAQGKAAELDRYRVRPGDILFSRMASVGRADVVPAWLDGALINYHLMRLRLAETVIHPSYFISYARGSQVINDYIRAVNHGATRDGINTSQLMSLPVALPPYAEQLRIIVEVERQLSILNDSGMTTKASLKRSDRLRQSILKRAFEGKLVPQDPSDEPASVLLERIRAERERTGVSSGRKPAKQMRQMALSDV